MARGCGGGKTPDMPPTTVGLKERDRVEAVALVDNAIDILLPNPAVALPGAFLPHSAGTRYVL